MRKFKLRLNKIKRRLLSKNIWLARGILIALVTIPLILIVFGIFQLFRYSPFGLYASLAKSFILTPQGVLSSSDQRTNILILGKAGQGYSAPDLTDTIILASVSHSNPKINLISLPRDIWIENLRAKLNSAYYWGNQKTPGGGLVLAKGVVEEIVGVPVHYGVVVDFESFMKIIDVLGGIQVNVETAFTDPKYPISGKENDLCEGDPDLSCRYQPLHFDKGETLMDGETALRFVRSRNAPGDEGTDLARAARQQKVLKAIKDKLLSRETLLSPRKLLAVKKVLEESVETDLTPTESASLARYVFEARDNIQESVLSDEFLVNPPISPRYDNQYVFIPKTGNWKEVGEWVRSFLSQ